MTQANISPIISNGGVLLHAHSLKTRALIVCLALFLAVTAIATAAGQEESRLAQVERLMKQQDYSQALLLLASIQRSNPELRDQTNRLVGQIMAIKAQYNVLAAQLNDAQQQGDSARIDLLANQLEKLDPQRFDLEGGGSRTVAGLYRVMNNALDLLQAGDKLAAAGNIREAQGKYRAALAAYLQLFNDPAKAGVQLPSGAFEKAAYGEIITLSVEQTVADIASAAKAESDSPPDVAAMRPALAALLAHPGADATAQFDRLSAPLLAAAQAEGKVRAGAAALADIQGTIPQKGGRPDAYLQYLGWIYLGRGKGRDEGLAYALRRLWTDDAQLAAVTASDAFAAAFESARSKYAAGSLVAADAEFGALALRASLAARAIGLASAQVQPGSDGSWTAVPLDRRAKDLVDRAFALQEYSSEAAAYRLLISWRNELSAMPTVGGTQGIAAGASRAAAAVAAGTSGASESSRLAEARTTLDVRWNDSRTQQSDWTARAQAWLSLTGSSPAAAGLSASAKAMAARFQAFSENDLQGRDLQYALRIANLESADLPRRLQDIIAQHARAEELKRGPTPAPGTQAQPRPDQALAVLAPLGAALDSLIADISAQEQALEGDKPWVKVSPGYAALFEGTSGRPGYNALLQDARSELAAIQSLTAESQQQMDAAAILSREGDNNWTQAQAAIKRGDPDGATSSMDLARGAYLNSLAKAYSDHAFARTTDELNKLQGSINDLRLTISVTAAQKSLANIDRLIAEANYLGASDALDAAVRAWNDAGQPGTYPPFDNRRLSIQSAVEISRGRVIPRSDPKADVVNAFVKNARDALASGRLEDAAQNVKDALAVAPNFGDARVLQLQIRRQADPKAFQKEAADKIAAFIKASRDQKGDQLKVTYNALKDYSAVDPAYAAQIKPTLSRLDAELNPVKPPSAAQVAQAAALVRQARALAQQGSQEALQRGLDLLKQAATIDPRNGDVVILDGQIRRQIGSQALRELSPSDMQIYNQAFTMFLSGAYQDAYDRVLQLWDDPKSPKNKTYPGLQRLKKRLEVQLNIS